MTTVEPPVDVFVIGGGINGVGIALDAVGRGLSVALCEMGDLAGATSSASSKLIHGGLRYLEHFEFRLVKEALAEREVLLNIAPHIASPLRFCLPHRPQLRPAWMIRAGLFLYDHLSTRTQLSGSHRVTFDQDSPLHPRFTQGFEYSDAWVDDARLVVLNALALQERGGKVLTRTKATSAVRRDRLWHITVENETTGQNKTIQARSLVNAAGPWVTQVIENQLTLPSPHKIRLVKGSHIVVSAIHSENRAYILQNDDQRIVFVIPYLGRFSLIGTTDVEYTGNPSEARCSEEEKDYLCRIVNQHFRHPVSVSDIVWDYAGVRPLCEDESNAPTAVTRDYTFEVEDDSGQAPLLSVFGGKLTTYRKLAEQAMNKLVDYFPEAGGAWTASMKLPGAIERAACMESLNRNYSWLPSELAQRFACSYGSLSHRILANCNSINGLGQYFGYGLYQREVDYLIEHEWVMSAEDLLWRRTKLGILMNEAGWVELDAYIQQRVFF